ncbi:MAG: S8 family serine peptidase, partial [Verrucomicrobiota bacterium]|nr:S8 family serine peptidase [Verrucomicrobiota bacterium]
MMRRKPRLAFSFQALEIIGLVLLLLSTSVFAQRHETFAERPSKRAEAVQRARERAEREREEAREWAKARGVGMRHDDGRRVMELMAIRNGRPIYYTTENDDAAMSTAADLVRNTSPYNVSGSGMAVGIWDAGLVYSAHREFGSRVTYEEAGESVHYHATHVGGTIGAAGITARAEGMAPDVEIHSYYWDSDDGEMAFAGASYPGEAGKIYLSNHSYGTSSGWSDYTDGDGNDGWHWPSGLSWTPSAEERFFGQYNSTASYWDGSVYDAPYYLPFKSAGNDRNDDPAQGTTVYRYTGGSWVGVTYNPSAHPKGDGEYKSGFDTIPTYGNAKNIMTVGAIDDAENGSTRKITAPYAAMSSFSGWGPTDDGRIKPDIVANGISLYSCDDDHIADYASRSGTSMSSPNACGSAALLVGYYDDRFPGDAMRASTLKGLIIHTADDLGRPGPDYSYGWGLMNTLAAAELIKDYADGNPLRMTEALLDSTTNQSDSVTLFSGGVEPVRVSLCLTDPPGDSTT